MIRMVLGDKNWTVDWVSNWIKQEHRGHVQWLSMETAHMFGFPQSVRGHLLLCAFSHSLLIVLLSTRSLRDVWIDIGHNW